MPDLEMMTRRTFWVRADGELMTAGTICAGDLLLVDAEQQAAPGDLVLIRAETTQRVAHYSSEVLGAQEARAGSWQVYKIIAVTRSLPVSS
jgi:hypothetical protein